MANKSGYLNDVTKSAFENMGRPSTPSARRQGGITMWFDKRDGTIYAFGDTFPREFRGKEGVEFASLTYRDGRPTDIIRSCSYEGEGLDTALASVKDYYQK
jgi:hypothetical protein